MAEKELGTIIDPLKVNTFCLNEIKGVLRDDTIQLGVVNNDNRGIFYSFISGRDASPIENFETGYRDVIVPIYKPLNGEVYWLGFSIIYAKTPPKRTHLFLDQLSLRVYRGGLTTEKALIFRAEWDSDIKNPHAQPHWHFHGWNEGVNSTISQIQSGDFQSGQVDFEEGDSLGAFKTDGGIKNFHFAMCSSWKENNSCQIAFDKIIQVRTWLKECLGYTIMQLKYITE